MTIDGFSPEPDRLRAAALETPFETARNHYPGIRAALPDHYLEVQLPIITTVLRDVFGRYGRIEVADASFSIVTTPRGALSLQQRLPHCDAFQPEWIALVHYLSPDGGDGTAFYRHRSTGFETINEERRSSYFERLNEELGQGLPNTGYIAEDTALFEQVAVADACYNRAILYPSFLLHSGAISPDAALVPKPEAGRLTVTGFFSVQSRYV